MAPKDGKALFMLTHAPGKTLQEAANAVMQQFSLQALESGEVNVNGLRALRIVADQRPQQQQQQQQQQQATARVLSYLIEYRGTIYLMIGASSVADFNAYYPIFLNTMQSFRELTDASKINKKPQRVRIKKVSQDATLQQVLRGYNVPDSKLEEMALLNSMMLTDRIASGTLIKVVQE